MLIFAFPIRVYRCTSVVIPKSRYFPSALREKCVSFREPLLLKERYSRTPKIELYVSPSIETFLYNPARTLNFS